MQKTTTIHAAELAMLILLAALLAWGTALERQSQAISGHLIRLHVVASSDDPEDQQIKLAVRDTVLARAEPLLARAGSRDEAKAILQDNLDELAQAANETLAARGTSDRAVVSLNRELFGTRRYESFSLPGGYYDALRVTIGDGAGRNWWCVVYPQICTAATSEDRRAAAAMGGLTQEQVALLEGEEPEYRLKLRSMELLENLLGWFRGGEGGIPVSR